MADGTIKIATDVDEAGLKSGLTGLSSKATSLMAGLGKAAVAGTVAAGAAVGALVKKSVDAYSEFEQLRGGAESMFKDSSDKILEYANNGFATAQMSANQYLEIATSFSAALINDLGGDLDKAAESTDLATRVIADNWANFGGDLQMIQYTFQGFAKGNYMMLDNLKLGYGGTKTEMERLIKDANEYAATIGESSNLTIDSFADQIKAIDLIQQKLGFAGKAQEESQKTIQGSMAMTKAAWENLITGMSDATADIGKLVENFTTSLGYLLQNLAPVIGLAIQGIAEALSALIPILAEQLPGLINELLPELVESITYMAEALATILPQVVAPIMAALPGVFQTLLDTITTILPMILPALIQILLELVVMLVEWLPELVNMLVAMIPAIIQGICDGLLSHIGDILNAGIQLLLALVQAIPTVIQAIVNNLPFIIASIISGLLAHLPELIVGAVQLFMALIIAIPQIVVELIKALPMIITGIVMGLITGIPMLIQAAVDLFRGFIDYIANLPSKMLEIGGNIVRGIWDGINNMIGWVIDKIKGFGGDIINALLGVFGIQSPSKVMRDLVGVNIARGIVQGFFQEDPMGQIRDGVEAGMANLSANLNVNAEAQNVATQQAMVGGEAGISLIFNDVQTSPDSIYQKFRQQATYGLARKYG